MALDFLKLMKEEKKKIRESLLNQSKDSSTINISNSNSNTNSNSSQNSNSKNNGKYQKHNHKWDKLEIKLSKLYEDNFNLEDYRIDLPFFSSSMNDNSDSKSSEILYYIPNIITEEEEKQLYNMLTSAPKNVWTQLSSRKVLLEGIIPQDTNQLENKSENNIKNEKIYEENDLNSLNFNKNEIENEEILPYYLNYILLQLINKKLFPFRRITPSFINSSNFTNCSNSNQNLDAISQSHQDIDLLSSLLCNAETREKIKPNNVLINWYEESQGVLPHTDGPAYFPCVISLSLLSPSLFQFSKRIYSERSEETCENSYEKYLNLTNKNDNIKNNNDINIEKKLIENSSVNTFSILLEPRSLCIFADEIYSNWMHSIPLPEDLKKNINIYDDNKEENVLFKNCLNFNNCSKNYTDDDLLLRGERISLTFRQTKI